MDDGPQEVLRKGRFWEPNPAVCKWPKDRALTRQEMIWILTEESMQPIEKKTALPEGILQAYLFKV